MNKKQKEECEFLRSMSSEAAANWLMQKYEKLPYSLSHRSWKRQDQHRLAHFYLRDKLPFVSHHGYEAFLSSMSVKTFLNIVRLYMPQNRVKLGLLLYYIAPTLRKYQKNDKDKIIISGFISEVKEMIEHHAPL